MHHLLRTDRYVEISSNLDIKLPWQDAEVSILNNGDGTDVRWTSKVFKFDGMENNRVYLHCRARICFNNVDGTTCDKLDTCANRKRRALDGYGYRFL